MQYPPEPIPYNYQTQTDYLLAYNAWVNQCAFIKSQQNKQSVITALVVIFIVIPLVLTLLVALPLLLLT